MSGPPAAPLRPLRCTRCGGPISARLVYEGRPYLEDRVLDGYECDDYACGAEWDPEGDPVLVDGVLPEVEVEFWPRRWYGGRWRRVDTVEVVGGLL